MTSSTHRKPSGADRLTELAGERYRTSQTLSGDWNETLETILSHRSVRDFLPALVPRSAVELAIAAAQSAPSSSNLQAWSVVAVEDAARKERLNEVSAMQRQISQAPLLLVWLADLSRPRTIAQDMGKTADGLDYLESFLLAVIDAALAAQNAVVALESIGLGTCYIGAIRNDPEAVANELGLPDGVFPVFGLTVGYPDPALPAAVKPRLSQANVLHRERYDAPSATGHLNRYNAALKTFHAEQSLPAVDWTEQVSRRVGTVEALKGRHILAAAARKLGFALK